MARPPALKQLVKDDFPDAPDWLDRLFLLLNPFISDTSGALSGRLTERDNLLCQVVQDYHFTTKATPSDTFPLKIDNKLLLGAKPLSLEIGQIRRKDGATMANAWSRSWVLNQKNQLEVTFQGLESSVEYVCTFIIKG